MLKRELICIIWIFITTSLIGCAPVLTRPDSPKISNQREIEKNYEIGKVHFAYVGNPLLKFKDYVSTKTELSAMQASEDVSMTGSGGGWVKITNGAPIQIAGTYVKDKKKFTVLQVPGSVVQINVDELGKLTNSVFLSHTGELSLEAWKVNTPNAVFTPSVKTSVNLSAGYQNFEIIYSGKSDKSINLTYREYTANDIARPAFQQNLSYDAGAKEFRFKNYLFELISATNEKIEIKVLSE